MGSSLTAAFLLFAFTATASATYDPVGSGQTKLTIEKWGQLAPNGSEGTLRTGGQFEFLQLAAGQVFWNELWLDLATKSDTAEVDIEPVPAFPGKLGRIGVLDLGSATVASDPAARTISVSGAPLTLTAQAAQGFNEAFAEGKPTFAAGEALGALSFVAVGQ